MEIPAFRYDCDFNQQLDLGLGRGLSVFDVTSLDEAKLKDVVPGLQNLGIFEWSWGWGISATPEVFFSAPGRTFLYSFIMFHHVYKKMFIIIIKLIKPCFFPWIVSSFITNFNQFFCFNSDGLVSARPLPLEGIVSAAPQPKGPADRELWCSVAGSWRSWRLKIRNGWKKIWRVQDLLPRVIMMICYVIIKWYCSVYL